MVNISGSILKNNLSIKNFQHICEIERIIYHINQGQGQHMISNLRILGQVLSFTYSAKKIETTIEWKKTQINP
jgi:hypothetical protein